VGYAINNCRLKAALASCVLDVATFAAVEVAVVFTVAATGFVVAACRAIVMHRLALVADRLRGAALPVASHGHSGPASRRACHERLAAVPA
jgi:predicted naringenin-chalcone synthase